MSSPTQLKQSSKTNTEAPWNPAERAKRHEAEAQTPRSLSQHEHDADTRVMVASGKACQMPHVAPDEKRARIHKKINCTQSCRGNPAIRYAILLDAQPDKSRASPLRHVAMSASYWASHQKCRPWGSCNFIGVVAQAKQKWCQTSGRDVSAPDLKTRETRNTLSTKSDTRRAQAHTLYSILCSVYRADPLTEVSWENAKNSNATNSAADAT